MKSKGFTEEETTAAGFAQKERVIGGFTYRVTQLDAIEGLQVGVRVMNMLGAATAGIGDADVSFLKVAGEFATKLTAKELEYYCKLFSKLTEVEGGNLAEGAAPQLSDIFAVHFAGRYLDLVKWLAFCFEVNFQDFFDGAGDLVRKGMAKVAELESKSQTK